MKISAWPFPVVGPILSGVLVAACLVYCRFWWMPHPMTWRDGDCSIICWFYCATMSLGWLMTGFAVSLTSVYAGVFSAKLKLNAGWLNLILGCLLFPTGILNLYSAWLVHRQIKRQ